MRPHGQAVREQALTLYLALSSGRRTLGAVQRALVEIADIHVSEFTLGKWRKEDCLTEQANRQDAMVRERVVSEAAQRQARGVTDLLTAYDEVTGKALDRILEEIETVAIRNASDLRVLVSLTLDLQARADALRAAATPPEPQTSRNLDFTDLLDRYRNVPGDTQPR